VSGVYLAALGRVDSLYEQVVTTPQTWSDEMLAEWGSEMFVDGAAPSRELAREVRRCLRAARKLRDFWLEPPPGVPSDAGDWRTRVDVALGIRAWRPLLAITQAGLHDAPSEELFDEAKARFREVHGERWMEGVSYEQWLNGS
jgi:hypothetical protein